MGELSQRRSRLSPAQRARLERRLRGEAPAAAAGIPRLTDRSRVPLSFAQRRVWFLEQLEPGNPFFHLAHAYRLSGPLDAGALRAAFEALVRRHEALHTRFIETSDEPVQRVQPPDRLRLPRIDLGRLEGPRGELEARRIAEAETRRPFDLERGPLLRIRLLGLGAEPCRPELARRWVRGRRLYNGYGPTEATACDTLERYDGGDRLPIGRPLAATAAHLLGSRLRPVPPGVTGEVVLGGPLLARGYLGRPALTAERFGPDPGGEPPGSRLYRTGDLARRLADGRIEFLGRLDRQAKVRGFRVEPGEVEVALGRHPAVREAAVAVTRHDDGEDRRVAWVVPATEEGGGDGGGETGAPFLSELRRALAAELPPYMVPTTFIRLDALPRTATNKVDRKALPSPDGSRAAVAASYQSPEDPVQEQVAEAWREVLALPRVGIDEENVPSARMLRRAGFVQVDVFHDPLRRRVGNRRTAILRYAPSTPPENAEPA